MNACKTKRRIKRRNLDKRAKYSTILHRSVLDGVRRTRRVLIYPAVRRESSKTRKLADLSVVFPVAQFTG